MGEMVCTPYLQQIDEEIVEGWFAHRGIQFHAAAMPPDGVMVRSNGRPVFAVWAYRAVGVEGLAWIADPVSNPSAHALAVAKAGRLALEWLGRRLKGLGVLTL